MTALPASYDTATIIGRVRFLVFDVDVLSTPPDTDTPRAQWSCLFLDTEIQPLINRYASFDGETQINYAAADCLDAIASNAALLNKRFVLGDYQQDTRATANDLRKQAEELRHGADALPFDQISNAINNDFDYRREVWNEYLANQ